MNQTKEKFQEIISGSTPVLVDFYADWCGPCKTMAPVLEEYATLMGSAVRVLKINVDTNKNTANFYNIQAIPTLILFKNGKAVWRKSGLVNLPELRSKIQEFL